MLERRIVLENESAHCSGCVNEVRDIERDRQRQREIRRERKRETNMP